jgi:hypothetical protein
MGYYNDDTPIKLKVETTEEATVTFTIDELEELISMDNGADVFQKLTEALETLEV